MPRRTQIFQQVPWSGGVNTSVDAGMVGPNDLVQADNVVFGVTGVRTSRQGFDYFDTAIPAVVSRSSTGTTRTITFASNITGGSPNDSIIVVGEKLTIAGTSNANYNTTAAIVASVSGATITYTFAGAGSLSESTTASTATTVTRNFSYIGTLDFWYYDTSNHTKVQEQIVVSSQGYIFKYDSSGRRTQITMSGAGATAFATTPTKVDMRAFNNKVIFTFDGYGNTPKYYDPTVANEWKDLTGSPPDASIMMEHLGRLFMNDKLYLDRLHYCETFDETKWQGVGDSGAIDIAQEDGDSNGITCIQPPFKGLLLVSKGSRQWKIAGDTPEDFWPVEMTSGLGAISHKGAVAFDTEDQFFVSRRGIHSVAATDKFGDLASAYASRKIQNTFNDWAVNSLSKTQGVYLSRINSIAWIVTEDGEDEPNAIWLYNPTIQTDNGEQGVWFRWPNMNARCIAKRIHSNTERVIIGDNQGRLLLGQNGGYTDKSSIAIPLRLKSGTIYADGRLDTIKAYKKLSMIYKPKGNYSFTVYFRVDDFPPQAVVYTQGTGGDILGDTFTLGSSLLGQNAQLAPFAKDVYGHGRGCSIEVLQSNVEAQVEIYGYIIEYESEMPADRVETATDES